MSLRCLSVALALGLAPSFVLSTQLRVCAEPDNLPFSHADQSGFENRIAEVLAQDLGAKLVYSWQPQRRAFVRKTLGAGLCDAWMGVPADFERALTTRAYYRSTYVFVYGKRPLRSFDFGKYAVWKGVTIKGIFGRRMFETWYAMLDMLASEKSQLKARLERIITRETVPLEDFERGFEMVRSHQAVKLLLAPNGE